MNTEYIRNSNAKLRASETGVKWFQDNKFGMSIHWGLYSMMNRGEWALFTDRMDIHEYRKLAKKFNPVKFDAEEWVRIAADAGQKMILITSKHHDGFCMFDSELTDYKITNSPFGRDPLRELADACEEHNVDLHFYYSLLDWHHPSYLNDWADYIRYYHGQVRELCTRYGKLGGILFDGCWPNEDYIYQDPRYKHFMPGGNWEFGKLYDMIHMLQPDCVVTNNHHIPPLPGEDFQVFEQVLPGDTAGAEFNTAYVSNLPLVSWTTMNDSWCYKEDDRNFKSPSRLVQFLLNAVAMRANFFLNIGPDGLGQIRTEELERLRFMGKWLKSNGEAVYGTKALTEIRVPWGHVVQKESKVYLYVLHYPGKRIELSKLPIKPRSAKTMDGEDLEIETGVNITGVTMPNQPFNPVGTIIELS